MNQDELFFWHRKGFIPGPDETLLDFVERCQLTQKLFLEGPQFFINQKLQPPFNLNKRVSKPLRHWSRHVLLNRFDLCIEAFPAFFSNDKLSVIQGGATWFLEIKKQIIPLIQIAKAFQKGSFLKLYTLDEILVHEAIHAARTKFQKEEIFEEYFAYLSANSRFRRFFGPMLRSPKEGWFFLFPVSFGSIFKILIDSDIFQVIGSALLCFSFGYFGYGFLRLSYYHYIFSKCFNKLLRLFKTKEKSLSVMVRLTDQEIITFAKMTPNAIFNYANQKQLKSIRWKMIMMVYQ